MVGDNVGRILSIGGGDFYNREIKVFDDFLVSKAGNSPKVLYIGAALRDDYNRYLRFKKIYEEEYNASVNHLDLYLRIYDYEELQNTILSAQIIYVGGGSTKDLLRAIKQNNCVDLFFKAYEKNIILAGISAGAIYLYQGAYTDQAAYEYRGSYYNYKMIEGLGLIKLNCCPHYDVEGKEAFNEYGGIALENNTALYFEDDSYLALTLKGYSVYYIGNNTVFGLTKGNINMLKEK